MTALQRLIEENPGARLVINYDGAQIFDAREHILITFDDAPKIGIPTVLHNTGWTRSAEGIWSRKSSPAVIMEAQALLNLHYGRVEK